MTPKLRSRRLWRAIERYVGRRVGRIRVGQLAHRFALAPSSVSRGLRRRGISLDRAAFPWELRSHRGGPERVTKVRQAMALYFLGLSRQQIERLLPIKSETVRNHILALTIEVRFPGTRPYRMFCPEALESLARELQRAYDLGDHVRETVESLGRDYFPADARAFLRQFRIDPPGPSRLERKLRQVFKTEVDRRGSFLYVRGRNNRPVKVRPFVQLTCSHRHDAWLQSVTPSCPSTPRTCLD